MFLLSGNDHAGEVGRVKSRKPTTRWTPGGPPRPSASRRRRRAGGPGEPSSPTSAEAYGEIADAVITLDTEGKVLSANPTAERLLGHGAAAVLRKPLSALVREFAGSYDVVCELVNDPRGPLVVILRDATERKRVSTLFRLEPSSTDLVALAVSGDVGEELGPTLVFRHGTGVTGLAVRERRAVVTPDLLSDPRVTLTPEIRAAIQRAPYRAVLAVPLLAKDSVVGALGIGDRPGRAFDDSEVQLAQAFAAQAAVALENSRLHEELHRRLQTVEASQQRLVETERLRASRDLATGVAHHLNNIMMVALGRLQLLDRKVDAREIRRDLDAVERAARNGASVIRRLMEFTEARFAGPTVPVDLNHLAQNALEMTRSHWLDEAGSRGIQVLLEPGDIPAVAGEPTELQEVFRNLLLNAIEALPSGGCIAVRTGAPADSVRCPVADSRPAVSEEARRRGMGPFFPTQQPVPLRLGLRVA